MFEATQEQDQQSSKTGVLIGVLVALALVGFGIFAYMDSRSGASGSQTVATAAAIPSAAIKGANPTKDLRVSSPKMEKDYTGTTANWSLDIKNNSKTLTYSNIGYETTYIDAGGHVLVVNKGTIPSVSVGPGEEQTVQFRDTLYPEGTAIYQCKITDASAAVATE
jgi:hypothetical protein